MDFMQRIDSIFPCACSVTDHRWRYSLLGEGTSDQEPATDPFWRHLLSIDEKTRGNMKAIVQEWA